MSKFKSWLIILLNFLLIAASAISLYFMWVRQFDDNITAWRMFFYVNIDAAIVLSIAAVTMIISAIQFLIQKRPNLHFLKYAYTFKMIATVWEVFVFLLAIIVGPWTAFKSIIFTQEQVILNIVLPLCATAIFIFLEYKKTNWKVIFYSVIPQIIYIFLIIGTIYTGTCQKALGQEAPYEIFFFKSHPVTSAFSTIGLVVATLVIGIGIYFANWAMFEKAYPRLATMRYQRELLKFKTH